MFYDPIATWRAKKYEEDLRTRDLDKAHDNVNILIQRCIVVSVSQNLTIVTKLMCDKVHCLNLVSI